jgi:hypothetical protein
MRAKTFSRICTVMFLFAWLNFMVFCFFSQRIGGEAFHGKIEDGHYYLATGYISSGPPRLDTPHGYVEVSPDIFRYSQVHGYSVLVTFPLGLMAGLAEIIYKKKRKRELTNAV